MGLCDPGANMEMLQTEDGRIHVHIPEMAEWIGGITPELEREALRPDPRYPLTLHAGRHMNMNANTLMRDPSWNEGRRACTMLVHPDDAASLHLTDGRTARITTEAGSAEVEVEVSNSTRKGQVIIPHGFGLIYDGKIYGVNVNRLTRNTHRDKFAATPLHRYVPCRVEPL